MLSGRDTLRRMDGTLKGARRDLALLETELQLTSRNLASNKLEQARAIDGLARVRLDAARRGEAVQHLEAATKDAQEILAAREAAMDSIADRTLAASDAVEALEDRRETLHETVDAAARTLAEREAAAQKSLETDDAFLAQLERSREADAIAERAQEKASLAYEDRRRKGEPFESDVLFMYLWDRGYGTSAYSANPIARMLDAWVARLCRFKDARANYWMLLEIPKRLSEHADHARTAAEAEVDRLQDLEEQAAANSNVPEARDALQQLEKQLDEIDADIESAERALDELRVEQGRYSAGEDDHMLRALRVFSAAMERRDLSELTTLARATLTDEDDAIVDELRHLRRQQDDLESDLREHSDMQRERLSHIQQLESVRRNFKRNRYDDIHSRFSRGDFIERMIGEVVSGVVQGSALWETLRRYQKYQDVAGEWPDFGSGGLRRPGKRQRQPSRKRRPSWHWPGPRSRSGGGFRMPRVPRSPRRGGGGGFRTGGGF